MSGAPSLFDDVAARAARDEAVDRVGRNAGAEWITRALDAVRGIAARQPHLTSDDVWRVVGSPPEPRALGAVMVKAKNAGLIRPTDRTRPSERVACHARPVRVWRSLHTDQAQS